MPSDTRVLITGGAGFIGSHLARALVRDGREVHLFLREHSDTRRIKDIVPSLNIHTVDLTREKEVQTAVEKVRPSGIFHLAVSTIASGVTASADELIQTNIAGTVHLVRALQKMEYDYLVTAGSFLEYGIKHESAKESDICEPPELYAVTKLAATLFCRATAREYKKPIVMLRLFTPYGPNIQEERLIAKIILNALRGEDIKLTRPKIARDYVYVDDIVACFLEAARHAQEFGGEIFNVGSGTPTSIAELVKYIVEKTGSQSGIRWHAFPSVSYDSDLWCADMSKTFSNFSWRPRVSLEQGLDKTIAWARAFYQL